jgi:tetratricopeptide (TPR) repeat protein
MSLFRSSSSPDAETRGHVRRRTILLTLTVFAIAFAAMRVASYTRKSATWDEPIHLTSGYAALTRGDFRIDPAHPPFARMWAALPLLVMDVTLDTSAIDRTPNPQWLLGPDAYRFARDFLYRANDADRLLYAARFMIVLLGIGAGVVLFFWAYEWLGYRAAACALLFYLISPNLTAHASLVTTDAAETLFQFAAVYFLWRYCRRPGVANLAALSAGCALAVMTKFSGVLLVPIGIALLAIAWWQSRVTARQVLAVCASSLAVTVIGVWAIYGFRDLPSDTAGWRFDLSGTAPDHFLTPIVAWAGARHLLPNAFLEGALYCAVSSVQSSYLLGEYSASGWWYYFPIAFLVKTPAAALLFVAVGIGYLLRHRRTIDVFSVACVIVPMVICFTVAILSGVNIGLRHILTVCVFTLLLAAVAAGRMLESRRRVVRGAFVAVTGFWIWSYSAVYPNTLTFFNRLAGGPSEGLDYLADSNLDWGQHLKSLKQWMDGVGVTHINLAYFGQADPAYYNIDATLLPGTTGRVSKPQLPGYVAVSATILSGVYLPPPGRLLYSPLRRLAPVAEIGHSIYVYWLDRWPEDSGMDADAIAERQLADYLLDLGWHEHAITHYDRARRSGLDARGRVNFGLALLAAGRTADGLASLLAAVNLAPGDPLIHRVMGAALLDFGSVDDARPHVMMAFARLPNDAITRFTHARLLEVDGQLEQAAEEFERALALDPTLTPAREHLTRIRAAIEGR